jgi:hypothetical protein
MTNPQTKSENNANSFTKNIGGATYEVQVFFNKNCKDSFQEKLMRLIKIELAENEKAS